MATTESSASAHPSTRELRGIALYREHGEEITYLNGVWFVPSQNGATSVYGVVLAPRGESCECADFEFRGGSEACKHVIAATIARAKTAPCAMCGTRHKHRDLHEVGDDNLTCFEGDLLCPGCAADHGGL